MTLLKRKPLCLMLVAMVLGLVNCRNPAPREDSPLAAKANPLFILLSPEQTHVDFSNTLTEGLNTNVMMYEYFYNGGGVAVGDVNGDGLPDIYFTGNMTSNRLYLNKSNQRPTPAGSLHSESVPIQFEDVTGPAGVAGREGPWKTGVTMADVNGDGLLDIYVCYSGNLRPEKRAKELFINQGPDAKGVPHFIEQAKQYGLDSPATSTQATFFDYDKDGDLDMFLLNHNPKLLPILDEASTADLIKKPDAQAGVRLFRNDTPLPSPLDKGVSTPGSNRGVFHDVTEKAGLSSSALTYGLGAGLADLNGDGWTDIYLSNDYSVPDYLYINNGNSRSGGPTFSDKKQSAIGHTSQFSMGNDVADINNDGLPDIFTLDMLPEGNKRQKLLFAPDNYEKFDLSVRTGFYYQYMRNMLQVNNGDGTFSEVGQLAGISNTDWSWAPLFADYDNDGWKDLYVTNGYLRDFTNMDFMKYAENFKQQKGRLMRNDVLELVQQMPASNVVNYTFKNAGNLTFADVSAPWGLSRPSNSSGAAYADLDNDGDLDLVVNNINQPAFIYQNQATQRLRHHYLSVKLEGAGLNTMGLGAKVTLYSRGQQQYLEQMPTRGYQSSVSAVLHFGLGPEKAIDSLRIVWLSGKQQVLPRVTPDQVLTLQEKNATTTPVISRTTAPIFKETNSPVAFQHRDAVVNDFKRQPLMVSPMSFPGPCLTKGDVNGDGLEDVYVGGGCGQAGVLFIRQKNGQFIQKVTPAFESDKMSEDVDAVLFDANGDGRTDLYVCSGGYDNYLPDDALLQDRLYLNDGKGTGGEPHFTKSTEAIPTMRTSKSCVRVADVNGDGHPDLFVGGRVIPGRYPETPTSYLLINDGKGHFTDQTAKLAPSLPHIGMVTDAAWLDLNGDHTPELILVGEWMPVTVFGKVNNQLVDQTSSYFNKDYRGWWNKLLVGDFNQDGKSDLIIGNQGLNTQCRASDKEPAELYYKDFDDNGSVDPILCFFIQGKSYPYVFRDELLEQISVMRPRFPDYKSYADATLKELFTEEELKGAARLGANYLKTAYFERDASGRFQEKALPVETQFAPVYTLTSFDYDQDGHPDLLVGGNMNQARLRFGKYDANYGQLLKGDGKGHFTYIPQGQSGFQLKGDVRSVLQIDNTLLVGINQQPIRAYRIAKKP